MLGRGSERAHLQGLLERAGVGESGVVVLRGEAGIGKTALIEDTLDAARALGMPVVAARGVEAEAVIPFAALSELVHPLLVRIREIPRPQAASLEAALAIREFEEADRFAVAAATLSLLTVGAEQNGLLVCLDDSHWVDAASAAALVFAARRLRADGVAFIVAVRDGEPSAFADSGFPELAITGVDRETAAVLVAQGSQGAATTAVAGRLYEATGGNPLALIELSNLLDPDQLAGRAPLDEPLRVGGAIERSFARRLEQLPDEGRRALTVAAASRTRDVAPILAALPDLELGGGALGSAESAGLISITNGRLAFSHPLLRSVAYYTAPTSERMAAHRALARHEEPARAAWHLAEATVGADETVAGLLEHAATDALARTGFAAAAAAFERAAGLSPDRESRARRLLAAGKAYVAVGDFSNAGKLLTDALDATTDELMRAEIQYARMNAAAWRGEIAFARELAADEAVRAAAASPELGLLMICDATVAAIQTGAVPLAAEIASRAERIVATTRRERQLAATASSMVEILRGDSRATEVLRTAEVLFQGSERIEAVRRLAYPLIWHERFDDVRALLEEAIASLRAASALGPLPSLLAALGELEFRVGRWDDARIAADEATSLAVETGGWDPYSAVVLTRLDAVQGREVDCRARAEATAAVAKRLGIGSILWGISSAIGLLELSIGRTTEASAALAPMAATMRLQGVGEPAVDQWAPNLIESYVRRGLHDEARHELAFYSEQATRTGRTSALGCMHRMRGMLASEQEFEREFDEAMAWHRRTLTPFELARTELACGERLRRVRQRTKARSHLRAALETFDQLGAAPWAERARAEIVASGETARRRDPSTLDDLTPQELQIARLAGSGLTNREVAERLFLSARTIDAHLISVYRKLDIHARGELAPMLERVSAGHAGAGPPD
jgi:DNA-binding CsgD family transcriptional regulator